MKRKTIPGIILTASFLSGNASLAYEIVWVRLLSSVTGSSVIAIAAVTSLYMGGLAAGSFIFDRLLSRRNTRPYVLYSVLQFCTGIVSSVCFFVFLMISDPASPYAVSGISLLYLLSALCVILPVICIGTLFPAAADIITAGQGNSSHKTLALLYASETGGGAAGAMITAFILIGTVSIQSVVVICASVHIVIGAVLAARKSLTRAAHAETETPVPYSSIAFPLMLAFTHGIAIFMYEMAWSRILSLYVLSNTRGFAVILTGFLTGIIAGSFCASLLLTRINPIRLFWVSQILLAAAASLFLPAVRILYTFNEYIQQTAAGIEGGMIVVAAAVTSVPLFFSGMAFASLLAYVQKKCSPSGYTGAGAVCGFNTAGAITGTLITGFLCIPLIGASLSIACAAMINLFLGAVSSRERGPVRAVIISAAGSLILISALFGAYRLIPPAAERMLRNGGKILFQKETRGGTVTVAEAARPKNLKVCFVDNNSVICNIYDNLKTVGLLGHLPFLLNPQTSRCMIVGFGTGVTARSVLSHPVREAVCAEICSGVIECAPLFRELNSGVLSDSRLDLRIDDGRHVLLTAEHMFDAVICDPVHPKLGSNSLYTEQFYLLCRKKLAPQGVFIQYIPFHNLTEHTFRTLLRTFHSVFPNCSFWFGASHGILAGIRDNGKPCLSSVKNLFNSSRVRKDLNMSGITTVQTFTGAFVCGGETIAHAAGEGGLNSDYLPVVESQNSTDSWKLQVNNIRFMSRYTESAGSFFRITDTELKNAAEHTARSVYYKMCARAFQIEEDFSSALRYLDTAGSLNPGDTEIKVFRFEIERAFREE